jgi:hypothetical protein
MSVRRALGCSLQDELNTGLPQGKDIGSIPISLLHYFPGHYYNHEA